MSKHRLFALIVVTAAGVAAIGAGVRAATSGGDASALPSISVFSSNALAHSEPGVTDVGPPLPEPADISKMRLLTNGVGRFDSRLVAFPTETGASICFSLVGSTGLAPAMSTCWRPHDPDLPESLRGQHFDAVALYSFDGAPTVQLFGVAFDDVKKMRVQVSSAWRDVPVTNNGFYLEIPGVQHEEVGIVEATLADGTIQVHDIQKGG